MDGLNTFVNGYQNRMQTVLAFNQKINNGEAALRQMLGQVGAVLGGAALVKYARDAAEADKIQQQLLRTLERTGQSGAAEALNAQATALQRVTHFSDEAVSTVQRLLISAGLSAGQTQALTERVLDFAQETGQSAESAAALIARTLRGQTEELGRYNIKLDTSKGKVEALTEALARYASGAARGAVADKAARENAARFADATENIGRAVNRATVPFLTALVPLLERVAAAAEALALRIAPLAPMLGDMAAAALPVIAALGLLAGAKKLILAAINPLRAAIVLLSGRSLVGLSNALATSTGGVRGLWSVLAGGSGGLTGAVKGLGSALAVVGSVAGAAFAGWQLGKMINELQVGGMAIKDWVAIAFVWIGDKFDSILSGLRSAWAITKAAGELFWDGLKLATMSGVLTILSAWNKLPFGQKLKVDLAPLRKEFDDTAEHISGAGDRLKAELAGIDADRAKKLLENAELAAFIAQNGRAAAAAGGAGAATGPVAAGAGGGKDLNAEHFGIDQAELFRLQTQLLQAQLAGNQAAVDRITDLLEEKKLKQELLALEGAADSLVKARLAAEIAARAKERARTAEEVAFQQQLGNLEIHRADIEANRLLSEQEKQRQVNLLLAEENRLIDAKLAKDEQQLKSGVTDQEKARLLQEIAQLRKQTADNQRTQEGTRPLSVQQGFLAGVVDFLNTIPTLADRARQSIANIGTALQGGISSSIEGLIHRTMTWGDALQNIASTVVNSIISAFANMVGQWIAKQIMMAVFGKAIQAASLAALLPIAAATTAMWAPAATAASIATLGGAAVEGAALAHLAILSSIAGFATGGMIRGPGGPRDDLIPARLSNGEFVATAAAVDRFGPDFFHALNAGALDLGALPGNVARQLPPAASRSAASPAAGGDSSRPLNIAVIDHRDDDIIERLQRDPRAEAYFVGLMDRNRRRFGVKV